MSDESNYRGRTPRDCGFTEAEIEARAVSQSTKVWKVRCLNGSAHKHDDSHPSAFFYVQTGWYGCNVCGLQGIASDRLYANQQKRVEGRRPAGAGKRRKDFRPSRIPEHATLTATHGYKRVDGSTVHRVRRYDWVETLSDGTTQDRKEYVPQHLVDGVWKIGIGDLDWQPYNAFAISNAKVVYLVEGEKCADALDEVAPGGTAVITSAFGTNSAWKTDWSCLRKFIEEDDRSLVLIPDCDKPGEKYIHSVAWELKLDRIKVIRVGDNDRDDGYDVADWLPEGHAWSDLPGLREIKVRSKEEFVEQRQHAKSPSTRNDRNASVEIDVEAIDMLNDFNPKPLSWLIEGVIPRGKLTLIVGRGGIGKSTMALWIAARLSSDQVLFDTPRKRAKTLIFTSEDDWQDTTSVRLKLMYADFANIGNLRSFEDLSKSFDWGSAVEIDALQRYISFKRYDMLVIDPIIDILGGHSNNDGAAIRRAIEKKLKPILASGCTVLGVHHERKDVKRNDALLDRALGSQAWTAAARSVIHMQAVKKDAAKRRVDIKNRDLGSNSQNYGVIVVSKSNIANVDGGWHYELPMETFKGHESPHPTIIMRASKIKGIAPLALVNQYDPFEAPPKPATQRLAEMRIKDRIDAKAEANDAKTQAINAVKELLKDGSSMKMKEIIEVVSEASGVGAANVKKAVREVCDPDGNARNTIWRLKGESG